MAVNEVALAVARMAVADMMSATMMTVTVVTMPLTAFCLGRSSGQRKGANGQSREYCFHGDPLQTKVPSQLLRRHCGEIPAGDF